jgi:hypothetical protein
MEAVSQAFALANTAAASFSHSAGTNKISRPASVTEHVPDGQYLFLPALRKDTPHRTRGPGRSPAIDVVLHRGRPAHPDRSDNFSIDLNGKPSTWLRVRASPTAIDQTTGVVLIGFRAALLLEKAADRAGKPARGPQMQHTN